ncbi:MAG TPA: group 1 truncated hemoglobin [Steroidobacteraceae bacterium]|nr:group 1 truncated hemoglobin [Steroidobacteraceae bacterium]
MKTRSAHRISRPLCALALLVFAGVASAATLYEQIGGEAKLRAAVEEFMQIVLADDRINFTFGDTELKKFKELLYEQICNLAHGPCRYTGRDMRTSHAKLNISDAQFNALAEDLYEAFDRVHVPYRLQNRVIAMLAPMERDIVKPGLVPNTRLQPR